MRSKNGASNKRKRIGDNLHPLSEEPNVLHFAEVEVRKILLSLALQDDSDLHRATKDKSLFVCKLFKD